MIKLRRNENQARKESVQEYLTVRPEVNILFRWNQKTSELRSKCIKRQGKYKEKYKTAYFSVMCDYSVTTNDNKLIFIPNGWQLWHYG